MNPVYFIGHSLTHAIYESLFSLRLIHYEKLIQEGPCIIVANHQSFLDPPLIGGIYETQVHFLARRTLFDPLFMKYALPLCRAIPIDQEKPDPGGILKVMRLLKASERVVIFPEGSRSPDGEIHEAMPGIGLIISKLASVPVQPLRISGAFDCLPIHSSKLRFRPITVSIGDPIPFSAEEHRARGRSAQLAIGQKIMDAIRALPTEI